eukprot:2680344-Amphidinium_carterae.1
MILRVGLLADQLRRNTYPNAQKLRKRMNPQQGCSGYCCQCSWRAAEVLAHARTTHNVGLGGLGSISSGGC